MPYVDHPGLSERLERVAADVEAHQEADGVWLAYKGSVSPVLKVSLGSSASKGTLEGPGLLSALAAYLKAARVEEGELAPESPTEKALEWIAENLRICREELNEAADLLERAAKNLRELELGRSRETGVRR